MDFDVKREVSDKYSLRGRVFSKLREDILNGKYKEHEELKEVAIGEEMGVSRTPVREAFRQLELEGLIQIIPNRGAYVTGISSKDVRDIYMIRSRLEGLCARWATDHITKEQMDKYLEDIAQLPDKITRVLEDKERIQWFASKFSHARNIFFIGRGIDYAICLEGSLKMKEISYIHSEGYAAGELKHGTISLIEDGTLVIGVVTQPDLYEKTVSNMVEVKSRGAYLMGLTTYGQYNIEDTANFTVYVPKTDPLFANSLAIVSLQLLAYYISVAKGLDVDKPRNLAKSVTVE